MIIVKLIGGLGNQMFQYAAGRSLAQINKTDLKIDLSGYEHQEAFVSKRQYMLSIFNIIENFATAREISDFTKGWLWKRKFHVKEKGIDFNPQVLKQTGHVYLDGYWQSEKYFRNLADVIKKEFTFKFRPDKENARMLAHIGAVPSVSIHVRRGDYVKDKATTKFHGVCDINYYRRGLAIVTRRVKKPTLFIFSDEPDWVKKNMKFDYPTVYVTHNAGKADHEDMRLMMACQHNIIVNSSFSWWGAWLNSNPNKVVIAPKRWFAAQEVKVEDRIPSRWIPI